MLTVKKINSLETRPKPYKVTDANGLYLFTRTDQNTGVMTTNSIQSAKRYPMVFIPRSR